MSNISELAKQTLIVLHERGLKPTPENYSEVFEELSSKKGYSGGTKEKIEKFKNLLIPAYQENLKNRNFKNTDELLSFLISLLNRQGTEKVSSFYEPLNLILKALLVSKDKKIKDMASLSLSRISKTMDAEMIFLLEKKWQEFQKNYENNDFEEELKKYGIKNEDFNSTIKKLLTQLDLRSYEYFASLLAACMKPSLVQSELIDNFAKNLEDKPSKLLDKNFKNILLEYINKRIAADMIFVQKNLSFFNQNLLKLNQMLDLLQNINQKNIDFVNGFDHKKEDIQLSFDDIKSKFMELNEKINAINAQIKITNDPKQRQEWSLEKEILKLDERFLSYKLNYALCLFSVSNYHFIIEKYGIINLGEILTRLKTILENSCGELDELWIVDEKSFMLIIRNKSYDEVINLVQRNITSIENYKFIYQQEVVVPRIQSFFMDKQSYPHLNIYKELLKKLDSENE
ncbi:hypothetical protein DMB92_01995 [Campylobacter sp. MIT 99-7217]|uniref:hypothetical protein n=1 Tax=Campylobacter sp. MIT 99-7217 TaxID=535091 RepID=UPI00115ACCE2|nr:hypothetical protein [Campylobacter sp. MIT 99-7217]TQR33681.1 hypothetical protein DMB92_01995 [Campylobacter sp. MIT 99-7217]